MGTGLKGVDGKGGNGVVGKRYNKKCKSSKEVRTRNVEREGPVKMGGGGLGTWKIVIKKWKLKMNVEEKDVLR